MKADSTDDEERSDLNIQNGAKTDLCKYKTEICKNYSEKGFCSYWNKCQFAHGTEELLKTIIENKRPAYRTKKCKSFWESGCCRYGFRCQFLHYENISK